MAARWISPTLKRDETTIKMASACEVHLRIMKQQAIRAQEMITIARGMVQRAIEMRRRARILLP
jgi:hypothetical protein